jgi:hypothetical protein
MSWFVVTRALDETPLRCLGRTPHECGDRIGHGRVGVAAAVVGHAPRLVVSNQTARSAGLGAEGPPRSFRVGRLGLFGRVLGALAHDDRLF